MVSEETAIDILDTVKDDVLILVLVEDGLREAANFAEWVKLSAS